MNKAEIRLTQWANDPRTANQGTVFQRLDSLSFGKRKLNNCCAGEMPGGFKPRPSIRRCADRPCCLLKTHSLSIPHSCASATYRARDFQPLSSHHSGRPGTLSICQRTFCLENRSSEWVRRKECAARSEQIRQSAMRVNPLSSFELLDLVP